MVSLCNQWEDSYASGDIAIQSLQSFELPCLNLTSESVPSICDTFEYNLVIKQLFYMV